MVRYECIKCSYTTNIKTHFERHKNTKKHRLSDEKSTKSFLESHSGSFFDENVPKIAKNVPKMCQNVPKCAKNVPKMCQNVPKMCQKAQ